MEQEKLYSPVNFFLRDKYEAAEGQYDDIHYWRDEISHEDAFGYLAEIKAALADDRKHWDHGRGLAEYLPESIDDVVISLIPGVELHGDKLWMVTDMTLSRPITPGEMGELAQWWEGQLSDGWGEGFEQREIKVDRGDLYVEPWSAERSFFIDTQTEFDRRMGIERSAPEEHLSEPHPDDHISAADARDALLTQIARKHCRVETLEERKRDSLDFHEVSVWGLKAALQEAFDAGAAQQLAKEAAVELPEPEPAPAIDEQSLRDTLTARLEQNLADMMNDLRSDIADIHLPTSEVVSLADRITVVSSAYEHLTDHTLPMDQVEYLLQFQCPLEVVADRWPSIGDGLVDMDPVMWDICDKQDALQGGYPLMADTPPATKEEPAAPASGKPSLLAGLREAKVKSDQQKSTPTTKTEPEL